MEVMWRRGQGLASLGALVLLPLTCFLPALAQPAPGRTVLGTIRVHRTVEIDRGGGAWGRKQSVTAVPEGTRLRTGTGGPAYRGLGSGGGVRLYPETHVYERTQVEGGAALRLKREKMAFRVPSHSRLGMVTSTRRVQTPAVVDIVHPERKQTGGRIHVEPDGETRIVVHYGRAMVKGERDASYTTVRAGEVATSAAGKGIRILPAQAVRKGGEAVDEEEGKRSIFQWLPVGSPLWLLMAGVVGGTLGGLAASGTFQGAERASPELPARDTAGSTLEGAAR